MLYMYLIVKENKAKIQEVRDMKIKKNIITMLGIVAIAGMCMVGCSNSSADGSST